MRLAFLVYGVVYVVIEMIGSALQTIGWAQITALDVATAATDACLAVALVLAGLLAVKLGVQRWGGTVRGWWDALGSPEVVWDDEPIGVRSWRSAPVKLTDGRAEPPSSAGGTYAGNPYSFAGRRWPADGGHQL
ncbi:MAG: uncharacterized protein JWR45_702 [Blastococcus sp.]|jgi:hypothetical protein|nr:uncharacterized protein [Blastococcus sp.]